MNAQEEIQRLHLVNPNTHSYNALLILRCTNCKQIHPASPAALFWFQSIKDKGELICPICKCKNFVRTEKNKTQADLMEDIIQTKTRELRDIPR